MVFFILSQKESNLISLLSLAGGFPLNFKGSSVTFRKRAYSLGHMPINNDEHTWHNTKKALHHKRGIQVAPNPPQLFEISNPSHIICSRNSKSPNLLP